MSSSHVAASHRPASATRSAPTSLPSPAPCHTATAAFDFHTVTCVTWSASGRHIGIGTPDGFRIFSAEPLLTTLSGSTAAFNTPATTADHDDRTVLQEVCRCAVYGGVGLLSLYRQSSVVAFTGVRHRTAASRVQLADMSRPPPSSFFSTITTTAAAAAANTAARIPSQDSTSRRCKPWPPEEDARVADWYEQWRASAFANGSAPPSTTATPLAFVECPSVVAALHFCPHLVIAATSGDPKVVGSHALHIFDHRLRPLYTLPVYPPSSNAHLTDTIAIAAAFSSSNGAGMVVQRLRVLLPGEKKGEVRLLTLKKSVLAATAYDSAAQTSSSPATGDSHRLIDRVLHQAPLRAVAISEDGKSGVTMSTQGMRLRVIEFVGDDTIAERLSLDRGRLPAVTDTVSLAIVPVPQPGSQLKPTTGLMNVASGNGGGRGNEPHERCASDTGVTPYVELPNRQYHLLTEALHDLVVCLTSSGTLHVFGCSLHQVLFYHSDKTLLPRVGYPFNFSVCVPSQLVREGGVTIFVTRSDAETSAARLLPRLEQQQQQQTHRSGKTTAWQPKVDAVTTTASGDFFAFQVRYPSHLGVSKARDGGSGGGGDGARSSVYVHYPLSN